MINKFKSVEGRWDWSWWRDKVPTISWKNDLSLCVVYCIWNSPMYLRFFAYSLIGQYKLTDISRTSVKVFISPEIEEEARIVLELFGLNYTVCQTGVTKYDVTLHPDLQGFDYLFICDVDTFFYGKRTPFYEKLCELDCPYLMSDNDPPEKVFKSRKVLSSLRDLSDEEYVSSVAKILDLSVDSFLSLLRRHHRWYLSCGAFAPTSVFKSDTWEKHVKGFKEIESYCDETVFLTYWWNNDIPTRDFNEIDDVTVGLWRAYKGLIADKRKDALYLVHPLHGDRCHDPEVRDFYKLLF